MAYDEYTVERVRNLLQEKSVFFTEKKMFGGLCFMVDEKMLCGISYSKKRNSDNLMIRIGEDARLENENRDGVVPMDFTGKRMKGFAFILPEGYDSEDDLEHWIDLCLAFNPIAKKSKK